MYFFFFFAPPETTILSSFSYLYSTPLLALFFCSLDGRGDDDVRAERRDIIV